MKKNRMMRIASALLVLALLTTSLISGTFAKYVTSATSTDTARVAYWGFGQSTTLSTGSLFSAKYVVGDETKVLSGNTDNVIAPGTKGETTFAFAYTGNTGESVTAPEVRYKFEVNAEGTCDDLIDGNLDIIWKLDGSAAKAVTVADGNGGTTEYGAGSFGALLVAIEELSGDESGSKIYEAGTLPDAFTPTTKDGKTEQKTHTISWEWASTSESNTYTIDGVDGKSQDEYDTYMANQADLDDCTITITITATQLTSDTLATAAATTATTESTTATAESTTAPTEESSSEAESQ